MQEGRGLGKDGQGIAQALQVEKTSRRGGRILLGETLYIIIIINASHVCPVKTIADVYCIFI